MQPRRISDQVCEAVKGRYRTFDSSRDLEDVFALGGRLKRAKEIDVTAARSPHGVECYFVVDGSILEYSDSRFEFADETDRRDLESRRVLDFR